MIKISIITVLFNPIKNGRQDMLLEAIDSVFNQDYPNKEHIIIDGNSNDGTQELLENLKLQGKITAFISEPDTGIYDAMNKGAKLASGDYIAFLNSDDYYVDMQALRKIAQHIKNNDYLYSPVLIEIDPQKTDSYFVPTPKRFLTKMPFAHQSLIVRKSLFDALNGFDTDFKLSADYDFIVRMMMLNNAQGIGVDDVFSVFRMGGISDTQSDKGSLEKIKVWTKNYGIADYENYIVKKVLPIKILVKIFTNYPHIRKNVFYECYRTLRKFCF